jgi:hypothetical protein
MEAYNMKFSTNVVVMAAGLAFVTIVVFVLHLQLSQNADYSTPEVKGPSGESDNETEPDWRKNGTLTIAVGLPGDGSECSMISYYEDASGNRSSLKKARDESDSWNETRNHDSSFSITEFLEDFKQEHAEAIVIEDSP